MRGLSSIRRILNLGMHPNHLLLLALLSICIPRLGTGSQERDSEFNACSFLHALPGHRDHVVTARALPAVEALLLLRDSIENWAEFSAANNFIGWEENFPICLWTGIQCNPEARPLVV
jgi:hypothetical protein